MAWDVPVARYIRNYEVARELGAGNFGTVYAAVGEVPGRGLSAGKRRLVAIKKLKDGASEQSKNLLRQEFALLDQVKHRGIVRVFEYIPEENAVVLEYVHGVTVRKLLEECARAREQVFTEAAIEAICELADALYQAYTTPGDNGEPLHLVHRDLKPDNIMITPQGEVKILDFGLARVGNKEFSREEGDRIKGTPIYMAPEQARGQEVDHRTDLFSLGLIAYELFMNRPAYVLPKNSIDPLSDIYDAIERGVLQDECKELEAKLPGVGPILTRLLSAQPKGRYQTGQDLLVDLRRQLYRDRGSYLKEFAEFFFGSIFDLPDPPNIDDIGKGGAAPSLGGGSSGKRMSMEDRLKASMAREAQARKVATQPSTWKGTEGGNTPSKAPARAESWEPLSAKPARKVDEGGQRAPEKGGKKGQKMLGARSPDETGMLPLVSLNDKIELDEGGGDPSATSFFAIPAPKDNNRARPSAPPPPVPGPPTMVPTQAPPQVVGPMSVSGPVVAGPMGGGIQGPVGGIQGPVSGIQGPVVGAQASYGANSGTPFQVGVAPPPAESESRTQSNLVYAILLAMFALVGVAIVVAFALKPGDPPPDPNKDKIAQVAEDPDKDKKRQRDTAPPPAPKEEPKPPPKAKTPSGPSTPKEPAPPKTTPGTLKVTLTSGSATSIEVTCSGGFRQRAALSGGSGSLTGVPQDGCVLYFKGGAPAQFAPVRGGQSLTCAIQATTAVCK